MILETFLNWPVNKHGRHDSSSKVEPNHLDHPLLAAVKVIHLTFSMSADETWMKKVLKYKSRSRRRSIYRPRGFSGTTRSPSVLLRFLLWARLLQVSAPWLPWAVTPLNTEMIPTTVCSAGRCEMCVNSWCVCVCVSSVIVCCQFVRNRPHVRITFLMCWPRNSLTPQNLPVNSSSSRVSVWSEQRSDAADGRWWQICDQQQIKHTLPAPLHSFCWVCIFEC